MPARRFIGKQPRQTPRDRGIHVLVVDDYPDSAESTAMLLRMSGYDVATALNGPAALKAAHAHRPDAVLLDLAMPGMDGCAVARALRRRFKEGIRLIAVSAYDLEEKRHDCQEAGFDSYLLKPANPADVERLLH